MGLLGTPNAGLKFAPPFGEISEKSPLRNFSVGTVAGKLSRDDSLNRSRLKKKKVFILPRLKGFTGPPSVPPKSCRRFCGRIKCPAPSLVKGYPEFNASLTRYSYPLP